ncbi:MAG: hypothetical protein R2754_12005 [Microthrixaceae bacterium]
MNDHSPSAFDPDEIVTVLLPEDEYPHEPDEAVNYNESMYLNAFDLGTETGGWFRLGNRVNEGYAELSVCVYLPGGRVGFIYGRPTITANAEMNAGGLRIDVHEPFTHLSVGYEGKVCLLEDPGEMANPRQAFADNPMVDASVELDYRGVSPMFGGKPQYADGRELGIDAANSFAKAHYEQHCAVRGTITVGDEAMGIDGFGLRDKSWGPRFWQAIAWYRWLPIVFGDDFAMMISLIATSADKPPRPGGMVLIGDEYQLITDCRIDTEWDAHREPTSMRCLATTEHDTYEVTGTVLSKIPLRNRRTTPDGESLHTRISEAMTRFECNGRRGIGMAEYLDQVVDGRPVGAPE